MSDEDLFTTKGGCHVFAVCLSEVFTYPLCLLRNTRAVHRKGIVHIYCLPANDVMIDFHGRGSQRSYLRKNWYDSPPYLAELVLVSRIKELMVTEFGHGGLYAEPGFLEVARRRALAAIDAERSKYEYIP